MKRGRVEVRDQDFGLGKILGILDLKQVCDVADQGGKGSGVPTAR